MKRSYLARIAVPLIAGEARVLARPRRMGEPAAPAVVSETPTLSPLAAAAARPAVAAAKPVLPGPGPAAEPPNRQPSGRTAFERARTGTEDAPRASKTSESRASQSAQPPWPAVAAARDDVPAAPSTGPGALPQEALAPLALPPGARPDPHAAPAPAGDRLGSSPMPVVASATPPRPPAAVAPALAQARPSAPARPPAPGPQVHIGTVEVNAVQAPAPPPDARRAAARTSTPLARPLASRYGFIQS